MKVRQLVKMITHEDINPEALVTFTDIYGDAPRYEKRCIVTGMLWGPQEIALTNEAD